jgi:hypothetical protein
MPMETRDSVERAFEDFCFRETLTRLGDRFRSPDFWRGFCPDLHNSHAPFARIREPYTIHSADAGQAREQLLTDGYFATRPIVTIEEAARLRRGIERMASANYPSVFACVYDEFWRLFQGLEELLEPVLGAEYCLVPEGIWAFYVPTGHSGRGRWSAASPHRDSLGPDPGILGGGAPQLINLWIPLTDADPLNSCMYVVPAPFDPSFRSTSRAAEFDQIDPQDIRALPARAGSVLGWSTHLLHWGSRSSGRARVPRISLSLYVQRADASRFYDDIVTRASEVPFEKRIEWIGRSMNVPELFEPVRAS